MAADVSATLDLDAKQFHASLSAIPPSVAATGARVTSEGEKAGRGFVGGLSGSFGALKGLFSGVLGGIGAGLGIGAITSKLGEVVEKGSRIHDISAKFGIDAEQLQLIGNAALQDGVSLEEVAKALNKLQLAGGQAGTKKVSEALAELKINSDAFVSANPAEKFFLVGDAWRHSAQGASDYASVATLIGTRNTDLIVTMGQSREQIEAISRSLGILTTASVNSLDEAGDNIEKFQSNVTTSLGNIIGGFDQAGKAYDAFLEKWLVKLGLAEATPEKFEGEAKTGELSVPTESELAPPKTKEELKDAEDIAKARARLNEETRKATESQLEPAQRYAALQADLAKVDAELAKQGKDDSLEKIKLEERRLGLTREMSATEKEWQRDSEAAEREKERAAKEAAKAAAVKSRTGAQAPEPSPYAGLTLREALHQLQIEEASKPAPETTYKTPEQFAAESAAAEAQLSKISGLGEATTDRSKLDLEGVRAGELEAGMQHALADQELQIAKWEAGERLLEQIRDNIGVNR